MSNWIEDVVAHSPSRNIIALAAEIEYCGASDSDTAGRRVKFRIVLPPEDVGATHPFAKFTRRRRGHVGTRFEASFAGIDHKQELMMEVQLCNWTTTPKGAYVEFQISYDLDTHPFMGFARATATAAGTRWMMTCVEKDDSEAIVNQTKAELAERSSRAGRRQTMSNVARYLTKNPRFYAFLDEYTDPGLWRTDTSAIDNADTWLKRALGINSKADLDGEGPEAVAAIKRFDTLRAFFVEWQERSGYDMTESGG